MSTQSCANGWCSFSTYTKFCSYCSRVGHIITKAESNWLRFIHKMKREKEYQEQCNNLAVTPETFTRVKMRIYQCISASKDVPVYKHVYHVLRKMHDPKHVCFSAMISKHFNKDVLRIIFSFVPGVYLTYNQALDLLGSFRSYPVHHLHNAVLSRVVDSKQLLTFGGVGCSYAREIHLPVKLPSCMPINEYIFNIATQDNTSTCCELLPQISEQPHSSQSVLVVLDNA